MYEIYVIRIYSVCIKWSIILHGQVFYFNGPIGKHSETVPARYQLKQNLNDLRLQFVN